MGFLDECNASLTIDFMRTWCLVLWELNASLTRSTGFMLARQAKLVALWELDASLTRSIGFMLAWRARLVDLWGLDVMLDEIDWFYANFMLAWQDELVLWELYASMVLWELGTWLLDLDRGFLQMIFCILITLGSF